LVQVVIVETTAFTARVCGLLSDDEYHKLQVHLALRPEAGAIIAGTGGLRKIRWSARGRGKRGGMRAIYYWYRPGAIILMLFAFAKNERDDLSAAQRAALRRVVEAEYR
jgi:hypothetical protein